VARRAPKMSLWLKHIAYLPIDGLFMIMRKDRQKETMNHHHHHHYCEGGAMKLWDINSQVNTVLVRLLVMVVSIFVVYNNLFLFHLSDFVATLSLRDADDQIMVPA
jgi:hypothetical protein